MEVIVKDNSDHTQVTGHPRYPDDYVNLAMVTDGTSGAETELESPDVRELLTTPSS
jgi:hypothetical protein